MGKIRRIAALAVMATGSLFGANTAHADHYQFDGVVTLCSSTCVSFASFDVGATLTGRIAIDTAPDAAWSDTDVTQIELEFENLWIPPEPFHNGNVTTANPLPITNEFAVVEPSGEGAVTGGTAGPLGTLSGTLLMSLAIPPFDSSDTWMIFDIVGPEGVAVMQLCTFFTTAGCIPGATQAMVVEGQFTFIEDTPPLVFPTAVDFGGVVVGDTVQGSLTVTNQSVFPLAVGSVTLSSSGDISIPAEVCSNRLIMPGLTCGVGLTFEPTTVGQSDTILRINYDPLEFDTVVPMTGTGLDPTLDADADGVPDLQDNCISATNADQRDSNGDGYGNVCDADFNGDCIVNAVDLGTLKSVFFTADADTDLNGDGIVNAVDLGVFKALFFLPPGPSGLASCPSVSLRGAH